ARAQKLLTEGDEFEADAAAATAAGPILQAHYNALQKYRDANFSLSEPALFAERKLQQAKSSTQELETAIADANKDGISTDYEKSQLNLLEAQLTISKLNNTELYANMAETADTLTSSLFEKARLQYSSLEAERNSLASDFNAMLDEMPPALDMHYSTFLSIDSKYFEGGKLTPASMGNLKSIQSSFSTIRTAINSQKKQFIVDKLPKLYSLTATSEGTPTLDQPTTFTIDLILPNSMPLAVEGRTTVDIPFPYEVSEADITFKSSNILGLARSGKTLTILMSSIPANSITRISFRKAFKPAETDSASEKVLSLSPSLLRKEATVRFTASSQLTTLRALLPLPSSAAPALLSAKIDAQPANARLTTSSNSPAAEVTMQGISEGPHELKLYYEVQNPYSITQANRQVKNTGGTNASISFDLIVTSNSGQLEDVPIYFVEQGAANAKYSSVVGASSAPLSLKIEPSAGGTAFSWKAPLLRQGEPLTYSVQYSVTDISAYVESILPASSADASSLQEKFSTELDSFEREQAGCTSAASSLRKMGALAEAESIFSPLNSASSLKESAMLLANSNKYSEALATIAAARATLSSLPFAKLFSTMRSRLFEGVQSAKADALKLSELGDANETIAMLNSADAALSSSSASASSSDWAGAFSSIGAANSSFATSLSSLEAAERGQIERFSSGYAAYLARKQNTSASLSKLTTALTYTVGNAEVKKASLALPMDIEKLKSSISSDEKSLDAVSKKLDASKPSTAIANARELQQAQASLASLLESERQISSTYFSAERKANLSYENARLMLAQLVELAPRNDKQLADEQSSLSSLLADSRSSLDAGRLLDSISLSQHVQQRVLKALERLPSGPAQQPAFALTTDVLIIVLSLAFIAGLVFLFARRRPSAPAAMRKLPSAGAESEFEL
ncbi:MAG: hypothetical protein WC759_05310, partial [Candidatus Micrarchaeia archaeon]